MTVLHLSGPVLVDADTVADQAWVVGGRITFERPRHVADLTTLDGVVVPGLVDVHCHVGLDSGGAVDEALAVKQALADRDAGTLLIRDAGSPRDTSFVHDRDDLPRLIRSGRFIAQPKRYLRHYAREIAPHELPQVAAEEAAKGDGWVKLIADWIDREVGDLTPLWSPEVLADALARVHAAGARATAHTFAEESIQPLLDAQIDCLEHGTGMTAAHIELAAARGIPVVPTLMQVDNFEGFAAQADGKFPRYASRMRRMHARRFDHVRDLYDAGVPLLVGTDAGGTLGHGLIAQEAMLMSVALPAAEVLAAATWRARAFLGAPTLTEGESADLVVLKGDPRVAVDTLADPAHVVLRGVKVA